MTHKQHRQKKPVPRNEVIPEVRLGRKETQTEERPPSRKPEELPPDIRVEPIERR